MGIIKSADEESLPKNLQICNSCNRGNRGDGKWFPLAGKYIPASTRVAHGFCLDCCEKPYLSLPEVNHLLADKTR